MSDGIVSIIKPPGITSQTAVSIVKRILQNPKAGHCGTLDPQTAGVLPICLGKATRLAEYIGADHKSYFCKMRFGLRTDTLDAWGKPLEKAEVPDLSLKEIKKAGEKFIGEIDQEIPRFSAHKIDGKASYVLARKEEEVKPDFKPIRIYSLDFLEYKKGELSFQICCGKGTYVRQFCLDLAKELHTLGYMTLLIRTSTGNFTLENSCTLEELEQKKEELILPMEQGIAHLPKIIGSEEEVKRIMNGQKVWIKSNHFFQQDPVCLLNEEGKLIALGSFKEGYGPKAGQGLYIVSKVFKAE